MSSEVIPKTTKLEDVIKKEIVADGSKLKSVVKKEDKSDEVVVSESKKRKREEIKEPSDPRKREDNDERDQEEEDEEERVVKKMPKRWWQGSQGFDFQKKLVDRERHAFNEDECCMCQETGELLCCDGPCFQSFHLACLAMQPDELPAGDWFCDECSKLNNAKSQAEEKAARVRREARERDLEAKVRDREDRLQRELYTVPSKFQGPAQDPVESARRGLSFIFRLAQSKASFAAFGSDMVQTFYDVATVALEPLRKYALHRVEVLAQWWKERYRSLSDLGTGSRPEPSEITDAIMGIYSLERVGITHTLKMETRKFVQEGKYQPADYFGFQAKKEGPAACEPEQNRFRAFTTAIVNAFYADKVGIDLGASVLDVFAHLSTLRPYRAEDELPWEEWLDQTTMLFNIIHVCSNFGELRLDPALIPEEAGYLLNPKLMQVCLREKDVHLVGELCHCMRVLGLPESHEGLQAGIQYLMKAQKTDGSWPARANAKDPYTRYHAAMCAVSCLHPPHFRGFGPDDERLMAFLCMSTKDHVNGPTPTSDGDKREEEEKQEDEMVLASCGIRVCSMAKMEAVRLLYQGSAQGMGGEMSLSTRERAERRLRGLLAWKKINEGKTLADFEAEALRPSGTRTGKVTGKPSSRAAESGRWGRAMRRASEHTRNNVQVAAKALLDRKSFQTELLKYRKARGEADLPMRPLCGDVPVDLYRLFHRVSAKGGCKGLQDLQDWAGVARQVQLPASMPDRSRRLRDLYLKFLGNFETTWVQRYKELQKNAEVDSKLADKTTNSKRAPLTGRYASDDEEWKPNRS